MSTKPTFTRYQVFIIVLISLLQFTVILDFMVMAPLGAMLIRILKITPSQFGWVVSVYAFSAGISGILAAGCAVLVLTAGAAWRSNSGGQRWLVVGCAVSLIVGV